MSPTSLRVLAGAAAAVFVLLTGIGVGFVGRAPECAAPGPGPQRVSPSVVASSPAPTADAGVDDNPGNGQGQGNGQGSLGGTVGERQDRSSAPPDPPAPTEAVAAPPATTQVAAEPDCTGTEPFAVTPALVALAGSGLTAAIVLFLLLLAGSRRPETGVAAIAPVSGGPARPSPGADPRLDADRAALVRACIYVRDRVTSRALADRLAAALRDAGVTVVEPVGDRFDPARHEAGGATPAADPSLTGTIAAVEVPGYVDRTGRVLRAPVVTVYQPGSGGGKPAGVQHTGAIQQPRRRTEEDR
jgi:hypothetical protein